MRKLLLYYLQNIIFTIILLQLTQYTIVNAITYFLGFLLISGVFQKYFDWQNYVESHKKYNYITKKIKVYPRLQQTIYLIAGLLFVTQEYLLIISMALFPLILINVHAASRQLQDVKTSRSVFDVSFIKQSALENFVYASLTFSIIVMLVL